MTRAARRQKKAEERKTKQKVKGGDAGIDWKDEGEHDDCEEDKRTPRRIAAVRDALAVALQIVNILLASFGLAIVALAVVWTVQLRRIYPAFSGPGRDENCTLHLSWFLSLCLGCGLFTTTCALTGALII